MVYFLAGCALLVLLLLAGAAARSRQSPQSRHRCSQDGRRCGHCRGRVPHPAWRAARRHSARGVRLLADPAGQRVWASAIRSARHARHPARSRISRPIGSRSSSSTIAGTWMANASRGDFDGRPLSTLSDREAIELLAELHQDGAPEAAVMEAYLDWRLPDWRERPRLRARKANREDGRPAVEAHERRRGLRGTRLGANANHEDIKRAHRRLMMKMHPDQGGSTYLAARINEAKDVLLGRG